MSKSKSTRNKFGGFIDFKVPSDARKKLMADMSVEGWLDEAIERLIVAGLKLTVWSDAENACYVGNLAMREIPRGERIWIVSCRASTVSKLIASIEYYWIYEAEQEYWGVLGEDGGSADW